MQSGAGRAHSKPLKKSREGEAGGAAGLYIYIGRESVCVRERESGREGEREREREGERERERGQDHVILLFSAELRCKFGKLRRKAHLLPGESGLQKGGTRGLVQLYEMYVKPCHPELAMVGMLVLSLKSFLRPRASKTGLLTGTFIRRSAIFWSLQPMNSLCVFTQTAKRRRQLAMPTNSNCLLGILKMFERLRSTA